MSHKTLSVIIICKNEERVIEQTLKSVQGWADEIVVMDSGSTDRTVEIAKKYTDKIFVTDWPGYGVQKNRALDKATSDWILSIDADEVVTDKLKQEISSAINSRSTKIAYRIPVKLFYFGKYIRSLLKRKPVILVKHGYGRFTEPSVHEALKVSGSVGALRNHLLHHSYDSLSHQISKLNSYAELWANGKIGGSKKSSIFSAVMHSIWMLIKDILIYGAVFDGWRGILLSVIHAQYTFNKYAFLKTKSYQLISNE